VTSIPVWSQRRFPMIYDGDKPTAVIIDLESFEQIELVMENLINREPEPEDELIAQSDVLRKLADRVIATAEPLVDWEKEIASLQSNPELTD